MDPRELGDAFNFVLMLALFLIMLVGLSYGVQESVTMPVQGQYTTQTNLSQSDHQLVHPEPNGLECTKDSETLYNPETGTVLDKPGQYDVLNYSGCWFNVTNYKEGDPQTVPLRLSYEYEELDTASTTVMNGVHRITRAMSSWMGRIAFFLLILFMGAYLNAAMRKGGKG